MIKSNFYEKYRQVCEGCAGAPVIIPSPDPKNSTKSVKYIFILERPGRIGTGKTGLVSFDNPDPTAKNFKHLFEKSTVDRSNIFITNLCIWYPEDPDYTDRPPDTAEMGVSVKILKDQISRVQPRVIVTLGKKALEALKRVYPESIELQIFTLNQSIGQKVKLDDGLVVYPVYHTSVQALLTRPLDQQLNDWSVISKLGV